MATRRILHINKLQEFEKFLETKGYMIVATSKNPYEVLKAQKDGDTVIVYKKKDAKEYLSTMDKDYRLVQEFIKSQRKQSNADRIRGMTDEELATLLLFFVPTTFERAMYTGISGKYTRTSEETVENNLEWLKQPAEEMR